MTSREHKFLKAKQDFLEMMDLLSNVTECDICQVKAFYESVYEFFRQSRPYAYNLTLQEERILENSFPKAIENAAAFTRLMYCNMDPRDLNCMKYHRSKVTFLTEDLTDLFKKVTNNQISSDVSKSLDVIITEGNFMEEYIDLWTSRDGEGVDYPNQVPNLNGVPENHDWWTQENRDLWKDKEEH